MPNKTTRSKPAALARAEHGAHAAHLSPQERKVLDEALRRGEDLREEFEDKTLQYGRWLLEEVFDNDTSAALDEKSHNPIWQELVRRAGGPTLGVTRHLLYVAVRIAANDRRIGSLAWRNLDVGRKELLLPLGDEKRLLTAAQHVSSLNLSQPKTREYVTGLLADSGKRRQVRLTPRGLTTRVTNMRSNLDGAARRVRIVRHAMKPAERAPTRARRRVPSRSDHPLGQRNRDSPFGFGGEVPTGAHRSSLQSPRPCPSRRGDGPRVGRPHDLRAKAGEMNADVLVGVQFHHGEGGAEKPVEEAGRAVAPHGACHTFC